MTAAERAILVHALLAVRESATVALHILTQPTEAPAKPEPEWFGDDETPTETT